MITLSTSTKSAIKTSLAMVIAYAVALQMNWDRPYWAGFAVAMISLNTVGQSLNKGAMRMLGTFIAAAVALTIIAVFPQQRWFFMVTLSIYIGLCTYMMGGKKFDYFYLVAGFVCVIICFDGGVNSTNSFEIAIIRVQETGMGILAFTLVNIFIWPQNTSKELNESICKLTVTQGNIFRTYLTLMKGEKEDDTTQSLRLTESQLVNGFGQSLIAAKSDSYEVWEIRCQWSNIETLVTKLMMTFERWRESFPEVEKLELGKIVPNIDTVCTELDMRFSQIEKMVSGTKPEQFPQKMALTVDETEIANLSHFEKAGIAVTQKHLNSIEEITRLLFKCIYEIKFSDHIPVTHSAHSSPKEFRIDTDRVIASIRVMITMWTAYLIWIYIRIPGDTSFVIMSTVFAMVFSTMPFIPAKTLIKPAMLGCLFGSALYIFIMPSLSGFAELSLMIFAAVFGICYFFSKPKQALGRTLGLILFLVLTSVKNEQTYNFLSVANTTLMFILFIALLALMAHIPTTAYPEKAFICLIRRFFRIAEFQFSRISSDWEKNKTFLDRLKSYFYSESLLTLTQRLQKWSNMIDYKLFPDTTQKEVQNMLAGLLDLTFRINQLTDARKLPHADILVQELTKDVRSWRIVLQQIFQKWGEDPAIKLEGDLQDRLTNKLELMEKRINETLDLAKEKDLGLEDYENFYNLLGCFQGLSQSVIVHEKSAREINWQQWRESRF